MDDSLLRPDGTRLPHVYFPDRPADQAPLDAKHRLADTIRRLIDECYSLDAAATGVEAIDGVTGALEAAERALAALPHKAHDNTYTSAESALPERSPYIGQSNPIAAPMFMHVDGSTLRGSAVYRPAYQGGIGDMHGGVVLGAFDDLLGCAQMLGPVSGRTGTLTVRFRSPSPIGKRIDYEARLDRYEGRKAFCTGEAWCDGVLLAEAEGIFVAPKGRS